MRIHFWTGRAVVALPLLIGFYVLCSEADAAAGQPSYDPSAAPPMFVEEEALPIFTEEEAPVVFAEENKELRSPKLGHELDGPLIRGKEYSAGVESGCSRRSGRSDSVSVDGCSLYRGDGCCPVWRFSGDAVLLGRDAAASLPLARQAVSDNSPDIAYANGQNEAVLAGEIDVGLSIKLPP